MADTNSAVLSGVLTFTAQRALLENLRANLVFANKAFAAEGRFIPGADVIKFASVDDLAIADTPLTEGTAPAATALVVNSTNLTADQYGFWRSLLQGIRTALSPATPAFA